MYYVYSRDTCDEQFSKLSTDEMTSMLLRITDIYNQRLYSDRNYAIADILAITIDIEYLGTRLYKLGVAKLLAYIKSQRRLLLANKSMCRVPLLKYEPAYKQIGCRLTMTEFNAQIIPHSKYKEYSGETLNSLCRKYNLVATEYQCGLVWLQLRLIIIEWFRARGFDIRRIEYKETRVKVVDRQQRKVHNKILPNEYGFATSGTEFSKFIVTLSQVCKIYRVVLKSKCLWWGYDGNEFAFIPGSIIQSDNTHGAKKREFSTTQYILHTTCSIA